MTTDLVGIIGGSGLGDALAQALTDTKSHDMTTPFGFPSGPIVTGRFGSREVAFINRHGPGHIYNPSCVPYAANIFALKELGVRTLLATAAVGSLQQAVAPGHLMVVDQFIDKTFRRQSSFFDDLGAVHCEMADPVCTRVRKAILETAQGLKVSTHARGTYICMEGPMFSTRAESHMHRAWGGDLIGMTAMPEAKLAREAQICYSLIALVSDYDCWQEQDESKGKQALLAEIIGNLQKATDNCLELLRAVLASDQNLLHHDCGCRKSLELAVWTPEEHCDRQTQKNLAILFE